MSPNDVLALFGPNCNSLPSLRSRYLVVLGKLVLFVVSTIAACKQLLAGGPGVVLLWDVLLEKNTVVRCKD